MEKAEQFSTGAVIEFVSVPVWGVRRELIRPGNTGSSPVSVPVWGVRRKVGLVLILL